MGENRGLYFARESGGLLFRVLTVGLVPVLALGILIGGDIASKKAVDKLNTTIETTIESIVSGSYVENSVKGTGKQDSTKDILRDWRAQINSQ